MIGEINKKRIEVLAKIENDLKEVEDYGCGKVIIFIKKNKIINWTILKQKDNDAKNLEYS